MASRDALIATMRARLEWDSWPRLTMTLIVSLAGLVAFLSSVLMLRGGLDSMAWRYGLSGVTGYVAFLGLIRLWIAAQRGWSPDLDLDLDIDAATWVSDGCRSLGSVGDRLDVGGGFDLDLDDFLVVVALLLLALFGLVAVAYVVYMAPVLFAEVALDAALIASVSTRLRPQDTRSWAGGVVSRTLPSATALVACLTLAGVVMSAAVPEANSIGGVIRGLLG